MIDVPVQTSPVLSSVQCIQSLQSVYEVLWQGGQARGGECSDYCRKEAVFEWSGIGKYGPVTLTRGGEAGRSGGLVGGVAGYFSCPIEGALYIQ